MKLKLFILFSLIAVGALARPVDITLLFTTDVHGYIWPTTDYEGRENVGGFLRCAYQIEQLRAVHTNSLLLDMGDTFQGSPESYLTRGRLLVDGLNVLRYDAWVLGNHELDWGPEALKSLHDQAEVPFLAANLFFNKEEENWLPKIQPYVIREIDGIKIAIIGLTTPGIPRWSRPYLLEGAMFKQSVVTLQEVMPLVKEAGADVIVVAAHQGYKERGDDFANEVQTIARAFPEIDVILGGHSHKPVADMRFGGVLYAQAGYHGIWLGQIDMVYDTVERKVVEKSGRLIDMDDGVPFHAALQERWADDLNAAKIELDQVLGIIPEELSTSADALGRSPVQQLIGQAIADGTGAEIVLHGTLGDESIKAGPITYRDVWKIVPYENTIGVLELTTGEIRSVLSEGRGRYEASRSLAPYGFTYTVAPQGPPEQRLTEFRDLDGNPLHGRRRYAVAMNSYTLASGGNRYNVVRDLADAPESRLRMLANDTRQLVVDHIKRIYGEPAED